MSNSTLLLEGGPQLGYVSKPQMAEFIAEQRDTEVSAGINISAGVAFNSMLRLMNSLKPGPGIPRCTYSEDLFDFDERYEAAVMSEEPELGPLINLDTLDHSMRGDYGNKYRAEKAQVGKKSMNTIAAFVENRKAFMGIRAENSAGVA